MFDIICSTEELPKPHREKRSAISRFLSCSSAQDRKSTLEIHTSIVNNSHINFDHCLMIVLASGIAAVGLLSDSTAFVLASFFISPLLSMIMAVAWGITIKDWVLVRRSFRNLVYGALLACASGMMGALLLSIRPDECDIQLPVNFGTSELP